MPNKITENKAYAIAIVVVFAANLAFAKSFAIFTGITL
jgi:hypothetical protein